MLSEQVPGPQPRLGPPTESLGAISSLVDRIDEHVALFDRRCRYRYVNRKAEQILGKSAAELVGNCIWDVFPEAIGNQFYHELRRAIAEQVLLRSEHYYAAWGRWFENVFYPMGEGVAVLSADITERKLAEQAVAEQTRLLAVAAAIGQAVATAEPLPEVLRRCAQALVDHLGAAFARIWTYSEAAEVLELRASAGLYTHLDGRHSRIPLGRFKIGQIATERRPHLTNEVIGDERVHDQEWARREGMVAFAGYPLLVGEQLVGVVAMFAREPLSDATLHALASVADSLAIGIRRKQAEAELLEQSEVVATINRIGQLLSAELDLHKLVQAVTDAATELTGAQYGAFFYNVLNEQGEAYMLYTLSGAPREAFERFPMPRATALFGPTFRGQGIIRLDDVLQDPRYGQSEPHRGMPPGHLPVRSYLAAPVISRSGEVLGGLFFGHSAPGVFTERSERLIVGIVAQAAIAIDNARLFQQAQAAEARYRGVFAGVADAILVSAEDGRYIETNPAASRLLGYTPEELRELRAQDVIVASPEWIEAESRRALRDGEWRGELELRRKDGSTVAVEVGATPVKLLSGPVFIAAVRDISERRAVERLQRDFLAMVSHELRNPLATVKGLAQLMQRRGAYSERAVEGIVIQANHLDRLVGDLLDVARLEAGRLELQCENLDLVALAAASVEQAQARTEAHVIRLEAPARPLLGWYDRDRLNQVLQNLLGNAIKYAPDGDILVRLVPDGSEVRVSVADRGPGIPPEDVPKLFERFYRSAATADGAKGLGIGLFVARTLIEAHGGRIWVDSQPGRGTEFVFTLPRYRAEVEHGK